MNDDCPKQPRILTSEKRVDAVNAAIEEYESTDLFESLMTEANEFPVLIHMLVGILNVI